VISGPIDTGDVGFGVTVGVEVEPAVGLLVCVGVPVGMPLGVDVGLAVGAPVGVDVAAGVGLGVAGSASHPFNALLTAVIISSMVIWLSWLTSPGGQLTTSTSARAILVSNKISSTVTAPSLLQSPLQGIGAATTRLLATRASTWEAIADPPQHTKKASEPATATTGRRMNCQVTHQWTPCSPVTNQRRSVNGSTWLMAVFIANSRDTFCT
jgi:hypothetical protein